MKCFVSLLILLALSSSFAGSPKVIYGEDNRVDVKDSSSFYQELARSTAAMVEKSNLEVQSDGRMKIAGPSMVSRGMCASERFSHQSTSANCSGFLVGDKYLVTAGHCMSTQEQCNGSSWVFDYKVRAKNQSNVYVEAAHIYNCSKIISAEYGYSSTDDYALIELDRRVLDRTPLEFRRSGMPQVNDPLVVIGHPTGLPTKVADGANIRSLKDGFFVANLDTYGGNSGSAVFNADTGVVEGILVRGETDYVYDFQNECRVSNRCENDQCRGEDVTYITKIKELLELI